MASAEAGPCAETVGGRPSSEGARCVGEDPTSRKRRFSRDRNAAVRAWFPGELTSGEGGPFAAESFCLAPAARRGPRLGKREVTRTQSWAVGSGPVCADARLPVSVTDAVPPGTVLDRH